MRIREIEEKDNRCLYHLIRRCLEAAGLDVPGTAYFDKSIRAMSHFYRGHEGRKYLVLLDDHDRLLGGAGFSPYNDSLQVAELQKLYLVEAARGSGLGTMLTKQVEEEARKAGFRQLYLETHSSLPMAIRLYRRLSYVQLPNPLPGSLHSTMNHFFIKDL